MSDAIIKVENLGKRYRLHHEGRERHTTLRDLLVSRAKSLFQPRSAGQNRAASDEDFWALKDVSFEVQQGEVVGIIGRNGAGKSTLLKILSRITDPTEGRITLRGRVASLLEVGTGFHPELTGRENVFLNGAILGMSRAEIRAKFDEIVAFAEVEKFLDTPVKRYSSGMHVRLAFAVAAHLEPEILVVDEVLAVGDVEFQKKCLGKMGEVSHAGRTVLFVSHQLGALRNLCTRGILMKSGRATSYPTVEEAIQTYLDAHQLFDAAHASSRHFEDIRAGDGTSGRFHLFFGEPLKIQMKLKNLPDFPVGVTIAIKDAFGRRLSLFSTNPHDGVAVPLVREATVEFGMDFCGYAPGEYDVDVAVTEPGIRIVEEVPGALHFQVLPAPRGGSLAYGAPFGEFFPKHTWEVGAA